jgi:virginiamycin B lyase
LNPKTGEVTEYHMPDGPETDPHTPVFDQRGIFVVHKRASELCGAARSEDGTGEIDEGSDSACSSLRDCSDFGGVPYFCEFGSNKLASIDPKSLAVSEYPLPQQDARPRRLALAPDGTTY